MELLLHLLKALIATFLLMLWVWNVTNFKNKTYQYMGKRCTIIWKMGPNCTAKSKAVTQQSSKLRTYYTILLSSYIFLYVLLTAKLIYKADISSCENWCWVFFFLFLLFTNLLFTDLNAHWMPKFSTIFVSFFVSSFFVRIWNSDLGMTSNSSWQLSSYSSKKHNGRVHCCPIHW